MSQVFIPDTLEEACQLLSTPGRILCAGATNLYVDRYFGKCLDSDMVSLHKLDELKNIHHLYDGWHIGSMCTFDEMEEIFAADTPVDLGGLSALAQASSLVGGPQVRNRGTIGGNIVSASPSADSVPVLMALGANIILESASGHRRIPIREFMTGVKKTAIREDEILTEIVVPNHSGKALFRKTGKRNALAIALCNVCVYAEVVHETLVDVAIAIGSCAPTCVRTVEVENALKGLKKPGSDDEWKEIKSIISEHISSSICPIDDVRTTASYRTKVAINVVYELLQKLWEDANE